LYDLNVRWRSKGNERLKDGFENVLEAAIVLFQNRILGAQIERHLLDQGHLEATVGESFNRLYMSTPHTIKYHLVNVVHAKGDAGAFEIVYVKGLGGTTVGGLISHGELTGSRDHHIGRTVLVAKRMTANHDRFRPSGHDPGHALQQDGFAKHRPAQDITDGAVGRSPHLLQLVLFDARFVRRDCGAFNANV
jgi:hypothetical protein